MTHLELEAIIDDALLHLGEHFSSVQIVSTLHDETGTGHYARGVGDWYARRGAVDRFLRDDAVTDATRQTRIVDKEDDREDWQL